MSVRLYVGNLPKELERQDLEAVFSDCSEDLVSVKLITDRKTGKCRGFGFVTVKNDETADAIVEKYNGHVLQDATLKIEKALPRAKGKGEEGSAAPTEAPASNASTRRKGRNNNRKSGSSSDTSSAVQPDPRWAQELEKLKQMLAAQTTSS